MSENYIAIYSSKVENPEITIAIPTYKRSNLLFEAILSAVNQETLVKYDIIVVDNNPERGDETEQLMEKFRDSSLVSYYKNLSNLGMVGNWNQLFNIARGQWVAMLHDDDLLYPNYITIMNKRRLCLDNPNVIIPSHDLSENREFQTPNFGNQKIYARKCTLNSFILGNIIGPPLGMLVKRVFVNEKLNFKAQYYPSIDWDFYLDAAKIGDLYYISDILCLYYVGTNESLKENTIINFYKNARELNDKLSSLLRFPFNVINKLCYRNLIINTIEWTSKLSDDRVIARAIKEIEYKHNRILEFLSKKIAKCFSFVNNYYTEKKL